MDETRTFEDLACWKAGRDLRVFVRGHVIPELPKEEKFRLEDQLVRASRSVTANIAEGHGRYHYQDNSKFCRQARGSVFELLDHLITAFDEHLISENLMSQGRHLCHHCIKILNGYIHYLQTSARENKQPPAR